MRAFALFLTTLIAVSGAAAADWKTLPLVTGGKIDSAWQQVDWGGFVVDQGTLRSQPDPRGMGLLVYSREKFGDCQIRIVYRSEKPTSNSGVFIRLDDGILQRIGQKTNGVERGKDNQLSPEMLERMKASSANQMGAWYAVHHGFEVQIQDAADSWHRTGAIYSLAEASAPAPAKSDWRTMILTLEGERVSVEVDGKPVSKFDAAAANCPRAAVGASRCANTSAPPVGISGCKTMTPAIWSGSRKCLFAAGNAGRFPAATRQNSSFSPNCTCRGAFD